MAEPKNEKNKGCSSLSWILIIVGIVIAAYSLIEAYKENFTTTDPDYTKKQEYKDRMIRSAMFGGLIAVVGLFMKFYKGYKKSKK